MYGRSQEAAVDKSEATYAWGYTITCEQLAISLYRRQLLIRMRLHGAITITCEQLVISLHRRQLLMKVRPQGSTH